MVQTLTRAPALARIELASTLYEDAMSDSHQLGVMSSSDDPAQWHKGCERDECRNNFIIPEILSAFRRKSIHSCAFVGSATGYIPSKVTEEYRLVECTLIDPNVGRMDYSKSVVFHADALNRCALKFEECQFKNPLDAVVISNTLMEFRVELSFALRVHSALRPGGSLLIFLPDVLEDVIQSEAAGNENALVDFLRGCYCGKKTDKFTSAPYNFYAQREIELIGKFVCAGFSLVDLKISTTKPVSIMLHMVASNG